MRLRISDGARASPPAAILRLHEAHAWTSRASGKIIRECGKCCERGRPRPLLSFFAGELAIERREADAEQSRGFLFIAASLAQDTVEIAHHLQPHEIFE